MLKILSILLLILFNQSISYSSDIEVRGSGGKLKGNKSFERLNKITKFKSTHNKIKNKTLIYLQIINKLFICNFIHKIIYKIKHSKSTFHLIKLTNTKKTVFPLPIKIFPYYHKNHKSFREAN